MFLGERGGSSLPPPQLPPYLPQAPCGRLSVLLETAPAPVRSNHQLFQRRDARAGGGATPGCPMEGRWAWVGRLQTEAWGSGVIIVFTDGGHVQLSAQCPALWWQPCRYLDWPFAGTTSSSPATLQPLKATGRARTLLLTASFRLSHRHQSPGPVSQVSRLSPEGHVQVNVGRSGIRTEVFQVQSFGSAFLQLVSGDWL